MTNQQDNEQDRPARFQDDPATGYWGGATLRECGEHRTVGRLRAWCFDCVEWCYPADGCKGCAGREAQLQRELEALENAELRQRLAVAERERDAIQHKEIAAAQAEFAAMRDESQRQYARAEAAEQRLAVAEAKAAAHIPQMDLYGRIKLSYRCICGLYWDTDATCDVCRMSISTAMGESMVELEALRANAALADEVQQAIVTNQIGGAWLSHWLARYALTAEASPAVVEEKHD